MIFVAAPQACWNDLLPDLLVKIASGREDLKAMQLVCKSWAAGFRDSASRVRMDASGYVLHALPTVSPFRSLLTVRLMVVLSGPCLQALRGSTVRVLDLSSCSGISPEVLSSLEGSAVTDLDLSSSDEVNDGCIQALCGIDLSLTRLNISFTKVGDGGLGELRRLPSLRSLLLIELESENPIESVDILRALPLTSLALEFKDDSRFEDLDWLTGLRGMQLSNLSVVGDFLDESFNGLEGMPLVNFAAVGSDFFSDVGMAVFRGMPLQRLCLDVYDNFNITLAGWTVLRGLPLKWLRLEGDFLLSDATLGLLRGLPLERLFLKSENSQITDMGFSSFEGMSLSFLYIGKAEISDQGLARLQGLPLTSLRLFGTLPLSDQGLLAGLKGMLLSDAHLSDVSLATDVGIRVFQSMPLTSLVLSNCNQISDASFDVFRALPLRNLVLSAEGCDLATNIGFATLSGSTSLRRLELDGCKYLTRAGLQNLEGCKFLGLEPSDVSHLCMSFDEPLGKYCQEGGWEEDWNLDTLRQAILGENEPEIPIADSWYNLG